MTIGNGSEWLTWNPTNSKTEEVETTNGPHSFKGSIPDQKMPDQEDMDNFHERLAQKRAEREEAQKNKRIEDNKKLKSELFTNKETYYPYSKAHEKILSVNAPEAEKNALGGACGGTSLVKLKDDGFGVFKPYDEPGRYSVNERREQIQNERAAYLVDLFLGFDLVPPTVIRALPDDKNPEDTEQVEVGSMQQFIEEATMGIQMGQIERKGVPRGEVMKLTMYDFMIQNRDRHDENYLVKEDKIYAIDHGLCLGSTIHGFTDDDPETVLSKKDPRIRSGLIEADDFWTTPLPQGNVKKLKEFAASSKEQLLFKSLIQELIGNYRADLYHRRIMATIDSINNDGILEQHVFMEKIEGQLESFYQEYDRPAVA